MSKELNIIEASKMPNTEFQVIKGSGLLFGTIKTTENGNFIDNLGNLISKQLTWDLIQAKFIPIQKSVSFIEAITQNHYNDKTIRCEIGDKVYTYKPEKIKIRELRAIETHGGISTEEILNGKWYIED